MKNIIPVILLLFSGLSLAQDLKADMDVIMTQARSSSTSHISCKVDVFDNHISASSNQTMKFDLKKSGKKIIYVTDQIETLVCEEFSILVNKRSKQIIYQKNEKEKTRKTKGDSQIEVLDSLINLPKTKVLFVGVSGGLKHYSLTNEKGAIERTEIYLNMSAKSIKKIEYYYDTEVYTSNNKVVVNYNKFNMNASFDPDYFSLKKYVIGQNNNYNPAPKWAGYKVQYFTTNDFDYE